MISQERILEIIKNQYHSEKAMIAANNNTFVFEVIKNAKKEEIKAAIKNIFGVEVNKISTIFIKGKKKKNKKRNTYTYLSDRKKAYVSLKKGQNLDIENLESIK
ncbi:50S ribosomal protein L23 [Candidatus Schneideria nysicola]|uniref:50S ribosomal protein L23 n=1 Tax=Candidatus Schneideria nysicola TaxID=1081631 RepID=UPI001CAA814B|nr:50S ribosomal protein L23 [Candidatus Schneideria nysicola]UAJ64920.1 50S ribosomal protein L23 [Candidatus Schneideria nysicola]UAJ65454.1 50S ribosomal protein L23 [Candidatus Schneideria nysicola]UAJ65983.1 50S ribosomal protein L23 [Candidatus Schneideria nysicola]